MLPRRVQPLAGWSIVAVFALIGAALLATVWSTRASILDASEAVRCGQADAVEQSVRADLADLDALPTSASSARSCTSAAKTACATSRWSRTASG